MSNPAIRSKLFLPPPCWYYLRRTTGKNLPLEVIPRDLSISRTEKFSPPGVAFLFSMQEF